MLDNKGLKNSYGYFFATLWERAIENIKEQIKFILRFILNASRLLKSVMFPVLNS